MNKTLTFVAGATLLFGGVVALSTPSVAAQQVTNPANGHSGSWNYGHDWKIIITYSETNSTYYNHSASVDSLNQGVKLRE